MLIKHLGGFYEVGGDVTTFIHARAVSADGGPLAARIAELAPLLRKTAVLDAFGGVIARRIAVAAAAFQATGIIHAFVVFPAGRIAMEAALLLGAYIANACLVGRAGRITVCAAPFCLGATARNQHQRQYEGGQAYVHCYNQIIAD
jgi:hypothetical protein